MLTAEKQRIRNNNTALYIADAPAAGKGYIQKNNFLTKYRSFDRFESNFLANII